MKKTWYSFSFLVFVSVFLVSVFAFPYGTLALETPPVNTTPSADSGITGDCAWALEGTKLTISGSGATADYSFTEPAPWGGLVTELFVEEGVTVIGASAFEKCENLSFVHLPKTLTEVKESAFCFCGALTNVYYNGTEQEAGNIAIGENNDFLKIIDWTCGGSYTLGDVDGASGLNSTDAVYLLYSVLFGTDRYPVSQPCDFNKDGVTNSGDAVYLLYHVLFGNERYPL